MKRCTLAFVRRTHIGASVQQNSTHCGRAALSSQMEWGVLPAVSRGDLGTSVDQNSACSSSAALSS
jgi:hypothetical protein